MKNQRERKEKANILSWIDGGGLLLDSLFRGKILLVL
jgi:hypothetical protein